MNPVDQAFEDAAHTISQRLAIYRVKETGIKLSVAVTLCDLMSELDPTGAHC